jgi:archaemetzincin
MRLALFHDRHSLADIACLKAALEDCYGTFGLRVEERGYLYVPFHGQKLNAARLLKHLDITVEREKVLWLLDSELFYPGIGAVFGCSTDRVALLFSGLDPEVLAKEARHEVGHLLGLDHCPKICVMSLSRTEERAREKPPGLCDSCSARLRSETS